MSCVNGLDDSDRSSHQILSWHHDGYGNYDAVILCECIHDSDATSAMHQSSHSSECNMRCDDKAICTAQSSTLLQLPTTNERNTFTKTHHRSTVDQQSKYYIVPTKLMPFFMQ